MGFIQIRMYACMHACMDTKFCLRAAATGSLAKVGAGRHRVHSPCQRPQGPRSSRKCSQPCAERTSHERVFRVRVRV